MQNEAELKDNILLSLDVAFELNDKSLHTTDLAITLNIEEYLLMYLCEDLTKQGYISELRTTNMGSSPYGSALLTLTSKGKYFHKFGGYQKVYRKEKRLQIWQMSKTIANILNALLVLGIAAYSVKVQIDANKKEDDARYREEIREWSSIIINALQSKNKAPTNLDTVNQTPPTAVLQKKK